MGRKVTKRCRAQPPPAKLKLVTFTGCWTCRSRKVKCDERQKNGCGVCERVGVNCAGYGVNLYWMTGQKGDLQGLRRRMIKPEISFTPAMSDDEIAKVLSAIDGTPAQWNTVAMGPFAVFRANSASSPVESIPSPLSGECLDESTTRYIEQDDTTPNIDTRGLKIQQTRFDMESATREGFPCVQKRQDEEISTDCDVQSTGCMADASGRQPLGLDLAVASRSDMVCASSLDFELSMPLFQDRQTSMLMYHYMKHVAELLQPVLHPQNPWRTTYFPFALQGCPDLIMYQRNTPPSYHASTALFHSLLSAAAFHIRNVTNGSAEFHHLGLQHRINALRALKAAPICPSDPQLAIVYLTAMLSLVTIDTMTGEDSDFPIHLYGCHQLRQPLRNSLMLGDSWHQVNSICRFLTLLARTTSHTIKPRPWRKKRAILEPPHFRSDERCIEYIYGVTPVLGNLLFKTCQISEHLAFYQIRGDRVPTSLQEACQTLGENIIAWTIESEPFHLIRPQELAMIEILRCQARAFHRAVLVFFGRTVQCGGATFFPPIDVESEVNTIWEDLTLAEDLKDACMGGAKRAAPMSWPAFIAACEAIDRGRWVDWWNRVQGYRVGNLMRQWRIICEIWSITDMNDSVTGWRSALQRTGKQILPI